MGFIKNWKKKREAAKEKRAKIEALFENFVQETRPLVPKARKHPEAALYRHVWKRACAYQTICQEELKDEEKALIYEEFQNLACKRYYRIAPENAYGTVKLKLSAEAHMRIIDQELKRLSPKDETKSKRNKNLACIYVGFDSDDNKPYVGQTIGDPEYRWKEHRVNGTGPFKKGASYASWKVIKENVSPKMLDELESYHIGFYNAFEDGYNDTKGNDWQAYEQGRIDRSVSQ